MDKNLLQKALYTMNLPKWRVDTLNKSNLVWLQKNMSKRNSTCKEYEDCQNYISILLKNHMYEN
jgi:hypothetical protein